MPKYSNGAFLFTRVRSTLQPMTPQQIEEIAQRHNIPSSVIPSYAGDRAAVSRAIAAIATQVSRSGWLLRPIKRETKGLVYGIVEESKDQEKETLELAHVESFQWSLAKDGGDHVWGAHPIASQVDQAFQDLRGKVVGSDWTE